MTILKTTKMFEDNFDLSYIKQILSLKNGELIVLGGRRRREKTSFVLSLLRNSSEKACFISLHESSEEIAYKEDKMNRYPYPKKNYESICIERPSLIELMELIVSQKDKFDYFVIDDLSGLEEDVNPLFSEDKNYQLVLRHLRVLTKSLSTNIILASSLDIRVDDGFNFRTYSRKEKFIDHILIIHHPAYYHIKIDLYNEPIMEDDAFLIVTKTKLSRAHHDIRLKFNYPLWFFPGKKDQAESVPF